VCNLETAKKITQKTTCGIGKKSTWKTKNQVKSTTGRAVARTNSNARENLWRNRKTSRVPQIQRKVTKQAEPDPNGMQEFEDQAN
jgi:hypothetical protein